MRDLLVMNFEEMLMGKFGTLADAPSMQRGSLRTLSAHVHPLSGAWSKQLLPIIAPVETAQLNIRLYFVMEVALA